MRETQLTPENLKILKAIVESNKIEVPHLAKTLKIDRGKLEGGVATLAEKKLISRKTITSSIHKLTNRGVEASKGLVEHKIIDMLSARSMTMKELNLLEGFAKGDIPAGIGILRKSGIIQ